MPSIRQTACDIVHRLRSAQSHVEVYTELRRTGAVFGYEAFLIAGLPRAPHENLSDCSIISGWPAEWERRYQDRRYMHFDPVIDHIRGTIDPFLWQDAVDAAEASRGMVVMGEARAFGLNEGLCVPFHQLDGSEPGVSFGATASAFPRTSVHAFISSRSTRCRRPRRSAAGRAARRRATGRARRSQAARSNA